MKLALFIACLSTFFVGSSSPNVAAFATKPSSHAMPRYPRTPVHHTRVLGRDGVAHDVKYRLSNGKAVWQGDMVIQVEHRVKKQNGILSFALGDIGQLWPNRTVNYCLDRNLNDSQTAIVNAAIAEWRDKTKMLFHHDGSPCGSSANHPSEHEVQFKSWSNPFCLADVGFQQQQSRQYVSISSNARYCDSGTVIHEIGHAIGLQHEQSRPDRDKYVTIHTENADPNAVAGGNFDIFNDGTYSGTPYDCASIMHYDPYTFAKGDAAVITANDPNTCVFGDQEHLSPGDIAGVKALYGY